MLDKPITTSQINSIHIALSHQGIDDEDYRLALKERFNVTTCKDLTRSQATKLLDTIWKKLPPRTEKAKRVRKKPEPKADNVVRLPTMPQRQLIEKLKEEIPWTHENGYKEWMIGNMRLKIIKTDAEAQKVINGLKAMKQRSEKK